MSTFNYLLFFNFFFFSLLVSFGMREGVNTEFPEEKGIKIFNLLSLHSGLKFKQ